MPLDLLLQRPFVHGRFGHRAIAQSDPDAGTGSLGETTYGDLLDQAFYWKTRFVAEGVTDGARVCAMVRPGPRYVAAAWGCWAAGGIWVPLATSHPVGELSYVLDDAEPQVLVVEPGACKAEAELLSAAGDRGIVVLETSGERPEPLPPEDLREELRTTGESPALMIYTSGTTGRPKGVLTTQLNLAHQTANLVNIWGWSRSDWILNVLPLHHVHGLVNALCCPMWVGATCEFSRFEPTHVWNRLASGEVTVFMAVPTVYHRLIRAWDEATAADRARWSAGARELRLMVSGSAALPVPVLERWRALTGHTLLERYGMTEIGMGLSNPLLGERRPGHVGHPLPGMEVRVVDPDGTPVNEGASGQLQVRGPQVFKEYWKRPDATEESFSDGWFQTGDEAALCDGYYRILGRRSVDILKTGGYKVSALEIEDVFREHTDVVDLAVVGLDSEQWGQTVAAAVVPSGPGLTATDLADWAKDRLAPYKIPRHFHMVSELPRNAMGKVQKPEVAKLIRDSD